MEYSVKKLAQMAGVSIRTLHLYDELGLLSPARRTEAGYRLYGEKELLKLQQVLFYKELDMPLRSIKDVLDDPDFNISEALEQHREILLTRMKNMNTMLQTIDKTIQYIKGGNSMTHEELYEGLPKEEAEAMRREAVGKWGEESVSRSENSLRKLTKDEISRLRKEQQDVTDALLAMLGQDPKSEPVQEQVARHYAVTRKFWGTEHSDDKQAEAYAGLGMLYVQDERYTYKDGKPNPAFAVFMSEAMDYFSKTRLG